MKAQLLTPKFAPVYSAVAVLITGFVLGALILARDEADAVNSHPSPPSTWFAGAVDTGVGVFVLGIPALIGAILRYFAYRRLENRFGARPGLVIPVVAVEALYFALAALFIWGATGPEEAAGWLWLFYFSLSIANLIISVIILVATLFVKPRASHDSVAVEPASGMPDEAHTLPTA